MKRMWVIILMFAVAMSIVQISVPAYQLPSVIKVGLYSRSNAVERIAITADGGMKLGYETSEGDFEEICIDKEMTSIEVCKMTMNMVAIPDVFNTYEEAWAVAHKRRAAGYTGVPSVINGKFRVVTGFARGPVDGEVAIGSTDTAVSLQYGDYVAFVFDGDSSYFTLTPLSQTIGIKGTRYRGIVEFKRLSVSDMTVINAVGLEDYLKGVLPKEVSPSWNMEALKAQAVVARTFAITQLDKYKKYGFNVDDTTASQVYKGYSVEHQRTSQAVDETAGEIIVYNGEPAEVYFSATSGGMTEDVVNVWGGDKPYLTSVVDIYENPLEATNYTWTKTLSAQNVKTILSSKGVSIGDITDIKVIEYTNTGRVLKMEILGTAASKTYTQEDCRRALDLVSQAFTVRRSGENITGGSFSTISKDGVSSVNGGKIRVIGVTGIYSVDESAAMTNGNGTTSMNLVDEGGAYGDFVIEGRGWGHGIGFSQWGAKAMGDKGFGYKEIIKFYFKGVDIR